MTENNPDDLRPYQRQPPVPPDQPQQAAPYAPTAAYPPPQPQAAYIQQPAQAQYSPPGPYIQPAAVIVQPEIPGKTLGIVSLILPFAGFGLIALILGIVALNQSKHVGYQNTPAIWGIILGGLSVVAVGALILLLVVVPLIIGGVAVTQN